VSARLVAGNWKMHDGGGALAAAIRARLGAPGVDVLLCPAFPYLREVGEAIAGSGIALGAQDLHWEPRGAFTGAVSAGMLRDQGCTHVIVGHSERRRLFGDTDASVAAKVRAARAAGLIPVLCVGETLEERDAGFAQRRVRSQVEAAYQPGCIVAYEPVWAIGTGRAAAPEDARAAADTIRAAGVRVLYGGSVTPANCAPFFGATDGALVGGASLDADAFAAIVRAAEAAELAGAAGSPG
jgi:triosephosphate isomerase